MNKWDYYSVKKTIELYNRRIRRREIREYAGRNVLSPEDGNRLIGKMLKSDAPFTVSRFGSTELSVILQREAHKYHRFYRNNDTNLCLLSGFFPNEKKMVDQFSDMMLSIVGEIDLLGILPH